MAVLGQLLQSKPSTELKINFHKLHRISDEFDLYIQNQFESYISESGICFPIIGTIWYIPLKNGTHLRFLCKRIICIELFDGLSYLKVHRILKKWARSKSGSSETCYKCLNEEIRYLINYVGYLCGRIQIKIACYFKLKVFNNNERK